MSIIRRITRKRLRLGLFVAAIVAVAFFVLFVTYFGTPGQGVARFTSILRSASSSTPQCSEASKPQVPSPDDTPTIHIDTSEYYSRLDFTPRYPTFWNRTFEERYLRQREKWKDLPLEVVVVPHSHNDPGWLNTYESYFQMQTSKILDNMLVFLNKTPEFTFIWSEISFFSKWWNKIDDEKKTVVKVLLKRGQLEITTGGWVMTDEATSHYYSMIDQLIEGHQWLKIVTDTVPSNGWSVDVFGHSSTMPLLLMFANISNLVVLRTHYAWKTFLAEIRSLDFYWEHNLNSFKIFCHMAPSDLYSIKHTCGPESKVCLQYDFRKIHRQYMESTATEISNENVRPKAERLLAQYGRYGSLFAHNVLLVPLGDDFRYDHYAEWKQQFDNYNKLFHYINGKKEWYAHVRFGTVRDYFEIVSKRISSKQIGPVSVINGDFFPYADTYSDGMPSYWTGYYTTRPFWKYLGRQLQHWLRASEILFSLGFAFCNETERHKLLQDYFYLSSARQSLALFQHHDAITGTSRKWVMDDYGQRLHDAIREAIGIVSHMSQFILIKPQNSTNIWTSQIYPDIIRRGSKNLNEKIVISIPKGGRKIVLFNSLTQRRQEAVKVKVNTPRVTVLDNNGVELVSQVNPVWDSSLSVSDSIFELVFICDVKPLSFTTYTLIKTLRAEEKTYTKTEIQLSVSEGSQRNKAHPIFKFSDHNSEEIVIKTHYITAIFTSGGLLESVTLNNENMQTNLNLNIYTYKPTPFSSGAYLFQPQISEPIPFQNSTKDFPIVRVTRGPIISEVSLVYFPTLILTTRVHHSQAVLKGLEIETIFNLAETANEDVELLMKLNSEIKSGNIFYTDSNGLTMVRRKYLDKLSVQGNYYPMTTAAYIEGEDLRVTLLSSHSHGVTSAKSGSLELMLDRRLRSDDNRGMREGVLDNKLTISNFWLLLERLSHNMEENPALSVEAHTLSLQMLYPTITLINENTDEALPSLLSFLSHPWPINTHLMNFRLLPSDKDHEKPSSSSLLIIHKKVISCKTPSEFTKQANVDKHLALFQHINIESTYSVSLTGTMIHRQVNATTDLLKISKVFQAYKITFR